MATVRRALIALVVVAAAAATPLFAQTRGVTAEDYFSLAALSDPHLSPDGTTAAFVITSVDRQQNRRHSALWTVAADGSGAPVAITASTQSSSYPRWSPDSKSIAFLSARPVPGESIESPRTQIWLEPLSGGEPRRLTTLLNGVSGFEWSPDGSRLVVVGRSGPSDTAKSPSDVRHYTHLRYKFNDTGWFDDKRTHLWVVDAPTGRATQITSGNDWDDSDPHWSPDGQRIAFVSDRSGKAYDGSRDADVWTIDASGGALTKISDHNEADTSPRWSPDGRTIAFIAPPGDRRHPKIWLASSQGGAPSQFAADGLDLIPTNLQWAEGGRALYFETGVKGTSQVYRVDLSTKHVAAVTSGERAIHLFDLGEKTSRLIFAVNDPTHPDDLYVADLQGRNERQLTHLNATLLGQLQLSSVERVMFKGANGWDIDGFLMKPIGWQADRKYPMVLSVHGGPGGQYGFNWDQEFQLYAARGWAVFFMNPRGSTGYGEKFELGIQQQWGGNDYIDLMNGVDAVLAKHSWLDRDRLGVTGGSYGGFMTNWIVGHTTRFKAAVSLRGVSNFLSEDGTQDGPYNHAHFFEGDLFDKFEMYWNTSPVKYARNVKTPTLVLHSDLDFRVPIEQGEQWFRALQHYGVPSEIVFFPRENHNLARTGEPKHIVESLAWQVYWFDRYLNGNANAAPPDAPRRDGAN